MKKNHFIIIFSAILFFFLLCWLAVIVLVVRNLNRLTNKSAEPTAVNITLCDMKASDLCIVNFGANNQNRMIINFQLPKADYPAFYVKAVNRGTVSVYSCEVTEAVPTSAYCTGVRTPLGETIDVSVYTTDKDQLIGHGSFLVSAIALSTPISVPAGTSSTNETPVPLSTNEGDIFSIPSESTQEATPTKTLQVTPTKKTSTPTPTKTPAYPYP